MAPGLGQRIRTALTVLAGGTGYVQPWHVPELRSTRAVDPSSALGLTAVYRCCALLSDAASCRSPQIFAQLDGGGTQQISNTAASRALATMTQADAELFAFSVALFGNGYLQIVRDGTGAPASLIALPIWRVTVEIADADGAVYYRIAEDAATNQPAALLAEADIVHARYRVIGGNRLMGIPPTVSCAPAFALSLQLRDVQRALFTNLAYPRTILSGPGKIDKDVAARMQTNWEQNHSRGNVGRVAVLGSGLEATTLNWSAVDAQLLEQVNASTKDIARAYGVPLQFLETDESQTYASSVEGTRALFATALRPFFARLCDAFAQKLLTRNDRASGTTIEFDASDILLMPGAEQADYLSKLANAGLATPNELRNRYLGLPDVEGGDVLRAPVNTQPIDRWSRGLASVPTTPTVDPTP